MEDKKYDNIQLMFGDCLKRMEEIPSNSVDLILCDLPYGTTKCSWDNIIPFDEMWPVISRFNCRCIFFATEPFTSKLICSNISNFKERITWKKHRPCGIGNIKRMHLKYTEDIVVFYKGIFNPQYTERLSDRVKMAQMGTSRQWASIHKKDDVCFCTQYKPKDWHYYNAQKKLLGNFWEFPAVVSNSLEKVKHPTQKPIKLLENILDTYSDCGQTILDFTMGSGSTMVACIKTNRKGIGIEIDENYYQIACKRVEDALREPTLFK